MSKKPLVDANEELFNIGNNIWIRLLGEEEFYLSASIQDIYSYRSRLKTKSEFKYIKFFINSDSKATLRKIYIDLPTFVIDSVLLYLPIEDIDFLLMNKQSFRYEECYGNNIGEIIRTNNKSKTSLWNEGFEGSISDYGRNYYGWVDCTWGDVSCNSHTGSWSMWVGDDGSDCSTSNCSYYPNDQWATIEKLTPVDVSLYTGVQFIYWIDYSLRSIDHVYRYYWNGSSWSLSSTFNGNQSGWDDYTVNLNNFNDYKWLFELEASYSSSSSAEGVYLDDMQITGTLNAQPDLTFSSNTNYTNYSLNGDDLTINVRVENIGNATASSSHIGYYLSYDNNITTADELIGNDYVTSLSAQDFSDESEINNVSSYSGNYYIGFIIDYQNEETNESNENNNVAYFSNTISLPSCTSPNININDQFGNGTVTMICNATGGSGGSTLYKWYNGQSCTGSVIGTNSSITISSEGYYTCKAYINGNESTCYNSDYGYAYICTSPNTNVQDQYGNETVTMICDASGGTGGNIQYKWYNGQSYSGSVIGSSSSITVSAEGFYSCKAFILGFDESLCYNYDYGYAHICTNPIANIQDQTANGAGTMECNVSGGSGGNIKYKWYNDQNCSASTIGTNSSLEVSIDGFYSCKVFIEGFENLCSDCATGYFTNTGINNMESISQILIYPNPSYEKFTIQIETSKAIDMQLKLFNIFGQLLYKDKLGMVSGFFEKNVSVSNFPAGIYTLQLSSEEGIASWMIVVEK
jgi:hypothetical protein